MSFGDETPGAFESRLLWGCLEKGGKIVFGLLLFLSGMKRPAKIREGGENLRPRSFCTQTSFAPKSYPAIHRRNCVCPPARGAVFIN